MEKQTYDLLWAKLAAKLNDSGPPDHTPAEWKKVWLQNKKRKLFSSDEPRKISKIGKLRCLNYFVESNCLDFRPTVTFAEYC